jgi:hypothetical protein
MTQFLFRSYCTSAALGNISRYEVLSEAEDLNDPASHDFSDGPARKMRSFLLNLKPTTYN